ncbi:MAG: hypothetical protein Kow0089_16190 [Desulfobulbaceae bacterium]
MLVICEDCAKKYNIDESRIRGKRARFTCNECGHIIIVDKEDLQRSLISGGNRKNSGTTNPSSSSVDLLQEMEKPLDDAPENPGSSTGQTPEKSRRREPQWKYRGIPVSVIFILAMLVALICVSLMTGYLYTEYLYREYMADITSLPPHFREELVFLSSLSFGAVWLFVLLIFYVLGRSVHNKFRQLIKNANQLAEGELEINIVKNGPREVRDLAFALERIRQRFLSD